MNIIMAVIFTLVFLTCNDEVSKNEIKIMVPAAEAIRPTELERRPFNMLAILFISLFFLKNS